MSEAKDFADSLKEGSTNWLVECQFGSLNVWSIRFLQIVSVSVIYEEEDMWTLQHSLRATANR
jgi:hypothetical protein